VAAGYVTMAIFWARGDYWNFPAMVIFWRSSLAAFLCCVVALAVDLPQSIASLAQCVEGGDGSLALRGATGTGRMALRHGRTTRTFIERRAC